MAKTLDAAGVKRLIQEIKGANKNLNTPIPISTENTPESMAQNVKNIADYVEKAKAAGIDTTKSFRLTLEIEGYPVEGSYDTRYIYGLQITDDAFAFLYDIDVRTGEVFTPFEFVTARSMQKVTSSMLDKGARKPIILTSDTTEVDEETYQKLLSNDVDVMFNIDGIPLYLNFKESSGDGISLWFGYITTSPISAEFPYGYSVIVQIIVTISSATPHKLVLSEPSEVAYKPDEFIEKSNLLPVLQEIDLTGTDADRKAKLDKFKTDWKALTGASNLTGARFVGKFGITEDVERNVTGIMTYSAGDTATEANDNCFYGICNGYSFSKQKSQIAVKVSCTDGSLTITPLFSHLEAIAIRTGNTPEDKAANVAAIKAYVNNLTALGVDVTKGYVIPCKLPGSVGGVLCTISNNLMVAITTNERRELNCYEVYIGGNDIGRVYWTGGFQLKISSQLTTTSNQIVGAINEVNALAKGYSTIFTPIELTTETAQNKTAIDARVAAFTAQGISLTNGCCIPVTYKGVYAGNISLINGDWYGLLVKNTNNPADNINIKLSADGTITEGNSAQ